MTPQDIIIELKKHRFLLDNEKHVQEQIFDVLIERWDPFFKIQREFDLNDDRKSFIDILAHETGIEVKLSGGYKDIYYQLERYCTFDKFKYLILATNKPMALPYMIKDKKCFVYNLSSNWL